MANFSMYFTILFGAVGFISHEVIARCPSGFSNQIHYGSFYYKSPRISADPINEACTWRFNTTRSDVVFSIQLIEFIGDATVHSFRAPDGVPLTPQTRYRYRNGQPTWCGSYVKSNKDGETTCQATTYPELCQNKSSVALTWPPQMTTNITAFNLSATKPFKVIHIFFIFQECYNNKIFPTTTKLPKTSPKSVETVGGSSGFMASITVLAFLLFITIFLLVFAAFKYKNLRDKLDQPNPNNTNEGNDVGPEEMFVRGGPNGNVYSMDEASTHYSVVDKPTRQMVDNVLYGTTSAVI